MSFTPATRISLALVFVTASILMLADLIGLAPSASEQSVQERKKFAEVVAVVFSTAVQRGEVDIIAEAMDLAVKRNEDLLTMAFRSQTGDLIAFSGDHHAHWTIPKDGRSTPTHWRVPIMRGTEEWGTVEVVYDRAPSLSIGGFAVAPLIGLLLFMCSGGFVAYRLLMQKALRHLDPSAVIPHHVQTTLDVLAEGVAIFDEDGQIVLANSAFSATVGQDARELLGVRADELGFQIPKQDQQGGEYPWIGAMSDGRSRLGVRLLWNGDKKTSRVFTVNGAPVLDNRGKIMGALATFDDLTQVEEKNVQLERMLKLLEASRDEVRRQNEQLHVLATRDPMTGCLNRRAFFKQIDAQFQRSSVGGHGFACIMSDIDHFKSFNDRYGHAVGDDVIKRVADCLQSGLREVDVLCRYGGEEFCVVLPGVDLEEAARVAEQLRKAIESGSDADLKVTSSFGVAEFERGVATPAELIDQADQALYLAKERGRNQVARWSEVSTDAASGKQDAPTPQVDSATTAQKKTIGSSSTDNSSAFELEESKRWYGEILELLASMSDMYADLASPSAQGTIFAGTRRLLQRTWPLQASAFALRQDDGTLEIVDCEPAQELAQIENEIARLNDDTALVQELADRGLVFRAGQCDSQNVLVQTLETESVSVGVFVGLLPETSPAPDQKIRNVFAIAMQGAARALENMRLYELLRAQHLDLEKDLGERTRELLHDRSHDGLTGLPNRALFNDRVEQAIRRCRRTGSHGALAMLDLDRFKRVNKLLGQAGGDQLLRETGERIDEVLRATDSVMSIGVRNQDSLISRLGGDEFGILLTDLARPDHVKIVIKRLMDSLARPFVIDGRELFITTSIGISILIEDGEESEVLISNAEAAMQRSKAARRNYYTFYSADMARLSERQLDLEVRLRRALQENQFHLLYQPKVDVQSGLITGYEALIRWSEPELGNVSPAEFIPVAEASGLIIPIGSWVLRQACADAMRWCTAGYRDVRVAVNLSAVQILQSDIATEIKNTLAEAGMAPELLEVEITESTIMDQLERATVILQELSDAGIGIAIDDFGTGYSSLNHLKRFPVTSLKIDGSFIRDLVADSSDLEIVKATVAMAHGMGISTVAECVETQEQMSLIRSLHCDEVQGYFFSRPLNIEAALDHLTLWQGDEQLTWPPQSRTVGASLSH